MSIATKCTCGHSFTFCTDGITQCHHRLPSFSTPPSSHQGDLKQLITRTFRKGWTERAKQTGIAKKHLTGIYLKRVEAIVSNLLDQSQPAPPTNWLAFPNNTPEKGFSTWVNTNLGSRQATYIGEPEILGGWRIEDGGPGEFVREYLVKTSPPTLVEGPWKIETIEVRGPEDIDEKYYLTNGKLRLRIDGGVDDSSWDKIAYGLNAHKIELWSDDPSPLIVSHLEEQVKELQGRNGLRWVKCGPTTDPVRSGIYPVRNGLHYGVCAYDNVLGDWNGEWPEWLSDSPAPEQVDPVGFAGFIAKKYMVAVNGWPEDWDAELKEYTASLQNKQA